MFRFTYLCAHKCIHAGTTHTCVPRCLGIWDLVHVYMFIHAGSHSKGPDLLLHLHIFRLREVGQDKQILWGQRVPQWFSSGEPKGPINSCGHLEASEGVFCQSERNGGSSQYGIVLEKNMNYLSVTNQWRGRGLCGKSGQHPHSWTPRAESSCCQSLLSASRKTLGCCSQITKVPKISLSMLVPPLPLCDRAGRGQAIASSCLTAQLCCPGTG